MAPQARAVADSSLNPETWVEQYGDYLYRYAVMRLKDPVSAEDVVQETLLAGIKGLDRFDGRVDIKYWLRGILRNKIVDHIRKSVRERPVEDAELVDVQEKFTVKYMGIESIRPKPWQFDPHRAYEKEEFWRVFEHCVAGLRDNLRQAFTLKVLEHMDTDQVCKVMGITSNNLWVLTHRARQSLKTCLEENWDRVDDGE